MGIASRLGWRSTGHEGAPFPTGTWAEVDQPLSLPHHLRIMLNHQQRVAPVAQGEQGGEQTLGVARVQSHRRFIEDVTGSHEAGTEGSGESRPLQFATRQTLEWAIERQVVEPHIVEKLQPPCDLGDHPLSHGRVELLPATDHLARLAYGLSAEARQGALFEPDPAPRRSQTLAPTRRANLPLDRTQSSAGGTGTMRAVEIQRARLQFRQADLAVGTGMAAAEQPVAPAGSLLLRDDARPLAMLQRESHRVAQPGPQPFLDDDAVDDHLDGVRPAFGQFGGRVGIDQLSIDPGPHKPVLHDLLEHLAVGSFAGPDPR